MTKPTTVAELFDYTDDPEKPCPTPTQESIPAAS